MLVLQTIRATTEADHAVRQGKWRGDLKETPDTRGLVVGIIGMGNIGKVGRSSKYSSTALMEGYSL
jgi:glyoxylate reductase